ncbi:RagB/SusD family nutrient uptake outer membrane protein [Pseudopedobacter beijingensis]|uniref:RagB/SusD family nutrient uptake outer membrane protein n=1 Tax=Pseudopedobacter beijingensis TaxID=1207056 RepID=A0ABW4IJ25_9SPHI
MKNIGISSIVCISFIMMLFSGCEKLDEKAYSTLTPENYFSNADEAKVALMGVYNTLNREHIWTHNLFTMVLLPNKYVRTRVPVHKSIAQFSFSVSDDRIANVWNNAYEAINRANTIIGRVPNIQMTDSLQRMFVAEAKFMRALSYFNLVRLYGGVPLKTGETEGLSTVYTPRSTEQEIYDLIVADLQYAESNNLPKIRPSSERGRATECAAKTLLGKVYLTMAGFPLKQTDKWNLARLKLKEVIDNKATYNVDLLPNYADLFDVNKEASNKEAIFAIQFSYSQVSGGSALPFFAAPLNSTFATANGQYNYGFTTDFRSLFATSDKRRDVTLISSYVAVNGATVTYNAPGSTYRDPLGIALGKYKDGPSKAPANTRHATDILVLRYADVLLMYAEAENEVNGPDNAYSAINEVRLRANAGALSGLTKDTFRDAVHLERLLELSGELHEFFDIKRLEKIEDHVTNSYEAQQVQVSYDPKMYLYPIPDREVSTNRAIGLENQNPGY